MRTRTHVRAQCIRYEPEHVMPEHVDGHRRLSILLSGTLHERDGSRVEYARPGSVGLKAPRFAHESRFGSRGTTIVSVLLPDAALERFRACASDVTCWGWHHTALDRVSGLALASAILRGDARALSACLSIVLPTFPRDEPDVDAPPALRALRTELESNPAQTPDVQRIADELGIHVGSLGRAFRRHFGWSMTRFRQRVRVGHAATELAETEATLTNIALDHGFADVSHMTRLFRRETGTSPGALRGLLRGQPPRLESFKTDWAIPL